jgi:triacylglycerol lipase
MGGLDARYMITHLDMAGRVLSLTTLGTPHRGSPFADWALRRFRHALVPVLKYLGVPCAAFHDLTVERCREFNRQTPDVPGVRYFSVAGRVEGRWSNVPWQLTAPIVSGAEGPNDGVVSVASAQYGESCDVWDCDHLRLVNWSPPWGSSRRYDQCSQYAGLVRRLADEGY